MFCTLMVLRPPAPDTVPVVVAARTLTPGHALTAADLTLQEYPAHLVPADALGDTSAALGRITAAGIGEGMPVDPTALVDASRTPKGRQLVPLRVQDPGVVALLRVGDLVSVTGADESGAPSVLARRVRVAAIPRPQGQGLSAQQNDMVVVDVDEATALRLTGWANNPALTISLG